MKEVQVQGGLGNQLFCMAFAAKLARFTGERVCVDASRFHADRYGRVFELQALVAKLEGLTIRDRSPRWRPHLLRIAAKFRPRWMVTDDDLRGGETRFTEVARRGRYFSGYWQHPSLVDDDCFREIAAAHFGRQAQPSPHVAIHFRSYREELVATRRNVPPIEYFTRSLEVLRDRFGTTMPVVVVTDSVADAEKSIGRLAKEVRFLKSDDPIDDFKTILNARASVLTNSSFSWWAGYLSRSQLCIYPAPAGYFHYPEPAPEFVCL